AVDPQLLAVTGDNDRLLARRFLVTKAVRPAIDKPRGCRAPVLLTAHRRFKGTRGGLIERAQRAVGREHPVHNPAPCLLPVDRRRLGRRMRGAGEEQDSSDAENHRSPPRITPLRSLTHHAFRYFSWITTSWFVATLRRTVRPPPRHRTVI